MEALFNYERGNCVGVVIKAVTSKSYKYTWRCSWFITFLIWSNNFLNQKLLAHITSICWLIFKYWSCGATNPWRLDQFELSKSNPLICEDWLDWLEDVSWRSLIYSKLYVNICKIFLWCYFSGILSVINRYFRKP